MQAQAEQRLRALRERLHSLQSDLSQAQGELEAVQSRVKLAEASLQRDSRLAEQGFVSHAQVQAQHEALLDLQIRERGAQRNLEVLRREARATEAEADSSQLQARTQQAQVDRTQATLDQEGTELSARNLVQLTTSRNGIVGHIAAHVGQSLQAGQTVLSLLPVSTGHAGKLQAELYAASRAAGFVESGQAVWLRLHAFPYQKFGMLPGEVTEVTRTPVLPQDLPGGLAQALLSAAQAQEPLYRITVALQADALQAFGRSQPLKAGMTLDADVIQDRRAIWEWVLEPLLAAKHRWKVSPQVGESESARPDNHGG